jgi:hypothetical protein
MATITLEVVAFHADAPFPALLSFLNASWKSCSLRVFSSACDSASITSTVLKMAASQFYVQIGEMGKVLEWVGDDNHVVYRKKNCLAKEEV